MAPTTRIGGAPRLGPGNLGSAGGVSPDGHALRHAAGSEPAMQNFGWLDKTGAAKTDARGTRYSQIDLRAGGPKVYTGGDQKNGRPKR